MLNYETILSSYDDRLTLLQWLKKVEDALANASFENFEVVSLGDATYKFKATFADGSEIESNEIRIGERISSAYIGAGNTLHLVTESGDDIDAGAMFNGDLNVSGNLAVSGQITGAPIIENMSGYSFTKLTPAGYTYNVNYAGVVKNGNKITFAVAFDINKTDSSASNSAELGTFTIPAEIGNALVPNALGYIDQRDVLYFTSPTAVSSKPIWIQKVNATTIKISVYNGGVTVNTVYYARLEATFLLSDNLAI